MMPLNTLVILVRRTLAGTKALAEIAPRKEKTPYVIIDKGFDLRCQLRHHSIVHEAIDITI